MDFGQMAIGGVMIIPLIIGLVQVIKKFGVQGEKLMWIGLGLGCFFGALFKIQELFPAASAVIQTIVYVFSFALYALSATGLYDLGKSWVETGKLPPGK